jgi:type VI secretion system secreted protein VgrG
MRRAKRPFNQAAIASANDAVANLTTPPGRPLDPHSSEDAALRKKWMDAYAAAGGEVETVPPGDPSTSVKTPCPPKIPKECSYLDKPYTVESSKANFDRIRKPATLSEPKEIKYKFPGDAKEQDALQYEVNVDGHKKNLIMPKNPPSAKSLPTAQQLADAMGTVPGPQLDKITQVVASPNGNPDDAYWAKEYKTPNFSSAATGGTSGVTFYPQDNWSQEFTDSTMIHEGGHSYSENLWSDADKKKAWEKAMSSDGRSPSKYADSSTDEDFSESLVMYSLSKGTKCEGVARQLYASRYKACDDLFGAKTP